MEIDHIYMHRDIEKDPRVKHLMALLGVEMPAVVGRLLRVWGWAVSQPPGALVGSWKEVERAIDSEMGQHFASKMRHAGLLTAGEFCVRFEGQGEIWSLEDGD